MRKAIIGMILLAAVVAFMLVGGFGRISAAKADNGATHYVGADVCLLDSAANCVANTYKDVSNHGGVEIDKYSADGVFNDTGKAVHWDNANTGAFCQSAATGAITTDWSETLSASGNAKLTCKFHS